MLQRKSERKETAPPHRQEDFASGPRELMGVALQISSRPQAILHDPGTAVLRGTVKRVHGLGPARRVEIALAEGTKEHLIEVDAPRDQMIARDRPSACFRRHVGSLETGVGNSDRCILR